MSSNINVGLLEDVFEKTQELFNFQTGKYPKNQNVYESVFTLPGPNPSEDYFIFLGYNAYLRVKASYAGKGMIALVSDQLKHEDRQRWQYVMKALTKDIFFDTSTSLPSVLQCEKIEEPEPEENNGVCINTNEDQPSETEIHLDDEDEADHHSENEIEEDEGILDDDEIEDECEPEPERRVDEITPFVLITRQNTIQVSVCPDCFSVEEVGGQYCGRCHLKFEVEECDHCGRFNYAGHKQCLHCQHKFVEESVEVEDSDETSLRDQDDDSSTQEFYCPECERHFRKEYFDEDDKTCPFCSTELKECGHCHKLYRDSEEWDNQCEHCNKLTTEMTCPHCKEEIIADLSVCPECDHELEMVECPVDSCDMKFYKGLEQCMLCEEDVKYCPHCEAVNEWWDDDFANEHTCDSCKLSLFVVNCPHCRAQIASKLDECPSCGHELTSTYCPNSNCLLSEGEKLLYSGMTLCPTCTETLVNCINPECDALVCRDEISSQDMHDESCYCSECLTLQIKVSCPHCHVEITSGLSNCPECSADLESFNCPNEDCCDFEGNSLKVYVGAEKCPWCDKKAVKCPHCEVMTQDRPVCVSCEMPLVKAECPYCHDEIYLGLSECSKCHELLSQEECPNSECYYDEEYWNYKTKVYVGLSTCPVCKNNLRNCAKCKTLMISDGRTFKCDDCI